jgi:hypothetical protein
MKTLIKKSLALFVLVALAASSSVISGAGVANAAPLWDLSGSYVINMEYLGTLYPHDMTLSQDGLGNLTGSGGSPAGANVYMWTITSGSIDNNTFSFDANYTATADAVTPQTVLHVEGAVAEDGTLSGTWSDNYQGGERSGSWSSESGVASAIEAPSTVKVTIVKYVDGAVATPESANNTDFLMNASWDAENIGSGSGQFSLSETGFNNPTPYYATTADMSSGASYSTSEVSDSDIVGTSCSEGGQPYALVGYSSGDSLAAAQAAAPSLAEPSLTNITSDKYIIVWNDDCATEGVGGGIGGDVEGGNGTLAVTSIDSVDTSAVANGTYEDGWEYVFNITVPSNEPDLAMKFADWLKDGGGGTIPVANNMRISSAQADNGGATITLSAANTYSSPALHITGDLNPSLDGKQVQVTVEVKVPSGTPNGSYTTTYGVKTE